MTCRVAEPGDALPSSRHRGPGGPWEHERLTGRENALYRQVRNEERKLARRMQAVEQLRQLAESTGDSALLETADRLEETALDRYASRLAKISEFQERFDLPAPDSLRTAPTSVTP